MGDRGEECAVEIFVPLMQIGLHRLLCKDLALQRRGNRNRHRLQHAVPVADGRGGEGGTPDDEEAVARVAWEEGETDMDRPDDIRAMIAQMMYDPTY